MIKLWHKDTGIRIFLLFVTALFFLLLFFAAGIHIQESEQLRVIVREDIDSVKKLLENQLKHDGELLNGLTDLMIEEDEDLRTAWLAKDRAALLDQALPIFNVIRSKYSVTHLYFIDLQGVCFLRVHDPDNFGDTINRFVLKKAIFSRFSTSGVELGPIGTLTLRSVYPWHINNNLEGYIELGEEIGRIVPDLKRILAVELIFMIDKSLLIKEEWEKGLTAMGKTGGWNRFRDFVIIDETLKPADSSQVDAYLTRFYKKHSKDIFRVAIKGRVYRGGFISLIDSAGKDLGDIAVLKDVTGREKSLRHLFAALALVYIISAAALFLVLRSAGE